MDDPRIDAVRRIMDAAEDVDMPEGLAAPHPGEGEAAGKDASDENDPGPPPPPPEDGDGYDWELIRQCAAEPLNDFGNARRYVIHFGENIRWQPRLGFFVWDERRWRKDEDEIHVRRLAHRMGELIARETLFIEVPKQHADRVAQREELQARIDEIDGMEKPEPAQKTERAALLKEMKEIDGILSGVQDLRGQRLRHAKNAGNSGPIKNMLQEAGTMLSVRLEDMDSHPLRVNCRNGTLHFTVETVQGVRRASVALRPHCREDLITRMIDVDFRTDSRMPAFQPFLNQVVPRPETQGYLQRIAGLSALGITEQVLIYLFGDGANGKSVYMDAIAGVLGEYATTAKIEVFTGTNRRSAGDATPELIPMIPARMVRASEPEKGVKWQEGFIKAMTGGEPMMARDLNKGFVEFRPRFTIWISGNYRPEFEGTDDGIWRRIKFIEWPVQIPEAERRPKEEMDARMAADREGILCWIIEGALNYLEGGLMEPEAIRDATQQLREESDAYGTFLEDACIVSGQAGERIASAELIHAFQFWLARLGDGYRSDQKVSKELADHARKWRSRKTGQKFNRTKSGGYWFYEGIRFTEFFRKDWADTPKDQRGRPLISAPSAPIVVGLDDDDV